MSWENFIGAASIACMRSDALWAGKSFAEEVRKIMDECALDAGIPCKAKTG
ncbi:MAG: hypothetical protein M0P13_12525 [Fibrobacteraceae bacterium]|nr:hypothetical protein [Fibrobacteraceae bacterium]